MASSTWRPLDAAKREIRLACVSPCPDINLQPRVRLQTVSLDSDPGPEFEAISYSWGDPSITAPIFLDGYEWPVTTNLEAGLRHLRDATTERILWIDAICINQSDIDERGAQVTMMKKIYSEAKCVRVWLGEAADGSDRACDILNIFLDCGYPDPRLKDMGQSFLPCDVMSLRKIFDRPWWQRVWVIQEFGLARSTTIQCGEKVLVVNLVSDQLFSKTNHAITAAIDHHGPQAPGYDQEFNAFLDAGLAPLKAFEDLQTLVQMKLARSSGGIKVGYLALLLALVAQFRASDNRDMIYGLLGLMPPSVRDLITSDYQRTIYEVYSDATVHAIQNMGDLTMFTVAELWRSSDPSLPSWVPDWRLCHSGAVSTNRCFRVSEVGFGTDFDASDSCALSFERVNKKTVKLQGFLFDCVKKSSLCRPRPTKAEAEAEAPGDERLQVLREACAIDSRRRRSARYVSGGKREEAYVQCLAYGGYIRVYDTLWLHPGPESFKKPTGWRRWIKIHEDHGPSSMREMEDVGYLDGGRPMIITDRNYIGIGPTEVQAGDLIYILLGATIPYVLRPIPSADRPNTFTLVGGCYIEGIMAGEAISEDSGVRNFTKTIRGMARRALFGGQPPDKELPLQHLEEVFIQ